MSLFASLRRGLALGLGVGMLCSTIVAPATAHDLEISVLGKSTQTQPIPSALGESFFTLLRGTSGRVGDEVGYQLGQINESGFYLRELYGVNVDPDLFMAFEGADNSTFELSISGFALNSRSVFRCPYDGCNRVHAYLEAGDWTAFGTYSYLTGQSTLTIEPPDPEIDLDADLNLLASVFLGWIYQIGEAVVESIAENAVENALQVIDFEGQLVGISGLLEALPSSVISALGVDPLVLLQSPFQGLSMDVSLIAPKGFSVPGKVRIDIYHQKPSGIFGSVVTSTGTYKKPRITWSAVPNATRYKVYSRSSVNSSWTYRATTTSTQWSDSTVSHPDLEVWGFYSTWYEYRVVAENSYGIQSPPSYSVRFDIPPAGGGGPPDEPDGPDLPGPAF